MYICVECAACATLPRKSLRNMKGRYPLMKKVLAIVLMLMFVCSLAFAEGTPALSWSDFEPALEAGGVTGQFYNFDEIAIKIWMPEGLNPVELTDEDKENGYIGYFQPDDASAAVAVMYVNMEGMSLEDYAAQLPDCGATEVEMGTVNGLPCVSYKLAEQDTVSVAFATEAGYILEVTCSPASEENADLVWGAVISSIQPE